MNGISDDTRKLLLQCLGVIRWSAAIVFCATAVWPTPAQAAFLNFWKDTHSQWITFETVLAGAALVGLQLNSREGRGGRPLRRIVNLFLFSLFAVILLILSGYFKTPWISALAIVFVFMTTIETLFLSLEMAQ